MKAFANEIHFKEIQPKIATNDNQYRRVGIFARRRRLVVRDKRDSEMRHGVEANIERESAHGFIR